MISVIIPNYNGARFLREAIDSALDQQGVDVEVIVVDDGSTDDSREIIESYGDRIWPIFQANQGACAARNAGLAMARGEYVKFLDGDDYLLPDVLRQEYQQSCQIEEGQARRIVFGDYKLIDADGQSIGSDYYPVLQSGSELTLEQLILRAPITSMPLYSTTALKAVACFDTQMPAAQEYDLNLRLYFAGYRFRYNGIPSYCYRQHQTAERISTKRHSEGSFQRRYASYQRHLSLAHDHFNGQVPLAVNTAFAHVFWDTGRFALRCGRRVIAQEFFSRSQQLTPHPVGSGNRFYRVLCWLFGPFLTEKVLMKARSLLCPSGSDV